jgi:hypothetical protein
VATVPVTSLALFQENKHFDEVRLSTVTIDQDVVARMANWVQPQAGKQNLQIDRLHLSAVRLTLRGVDLPSFEATIGLAKDGTLQKVVLREPRLSVELTPVKDQGWQAGLKARDWRPPLGWGFEFTDLSANARITPGQIAVANIEGTLYNGSLKGDATIKWNNHISAEGRFDLKGADCVQLLQALGAAFNASGALDTSVTFTSEGQSPAELFAAPRVAATFALRKGVINNVDVLRALQSPARGGKTPFDEITGEAQASGNRIAYRNLALSSGRMKASGAVDVAPNADLSGRINVLVGTQTITVTRGTLSVGGNLRNPLLTP